MLIDADKQKNASDWAQVRNKDESLKKIFCIQKTGPDLTHVIREYAKQKGADGNPMYDLIIIDVPGVEGEELRHAVITSHFLITPLKASAFDIWTAPTIIHIIREINAIREGNPINAIILPSMITTNAKREPKQMAKFKKVAEKFKGFSIANTIIHQREDFIDAAGEGKSVVEFAPNSPSSKEIIQLFNEVICHE